MGAYWRLFVPMSLNDSPLALVQRDRMLENALIRRRLDEAKPRSADAGDTLWAA
jgi:hypothetical protein